MPRAKVRPAAVRSDGQITKGNVQVPGGGQPNGRGPKPVMTQAAAGAGAGMSMPYGQQTQLQQAAAQTPTPPGVSDQAHSAATAMAGQRPNVTPLFAPTERPMEPVTAGAPMDAGPTNPMAVLGPQSSANIQDILQQAADATGNPQLRALANQAGAIAGVGATP